MLHQIILWRLFIRLIWLTLLWLVPSHMHVTGFTGFPYKTFFYRSFLKHFQYVRKICYFNSPWLWQAIRTKFHPFLVLQFLKVLEKHASICCVKTHNFFLFIITLGDFSRFCSNIDSKSSNNTYLNIIKILLLLFFFL